MNEEDLVKKAQKDKRYFDLLYRAHFDKIFAYIRKKVENKEIAEDITSEVFAKALKGIDAFQWEGISVEHWLYRIARNTINDYYRKRANRIPHYSLNTPVRDEESGAALEDIVDNGEEGIEYAIISSEEEDELYKVLMHLSFEDQYLVYYKYFEDMSNKQIAAITGLSETNVGTKLQRLRVKIKEILVHHAHKTAN